MLLSGCKNKLFTPVTAVGISPKETTAGICGVGISSNQQICGAK
jgi:hypothetical protein